MSTQEAEDLLAKGWILKQHKDKFNLHSYYIYDINNPNRCGCAKYINKKIAMALQKKGHELHTHVMKKDKL